MQPNIQQIPQPQMMVQDPQIQIGNPQQIPQNQLYQVIQSNSTPNVCEKFSHCLTGSYNIPFMVFLILMGSCIHFIVSLFLGPYFASGFLLFSSLGNFLFALFVWGPMAIKIEKNTSTVRYGLLYLINNAILSLCSLGCPLSFGTIWNFILFETLLIALSNKNKRMKFFCCKLSGNAVIASSIVYSFIFNFVSFFSVLITIGYTYAYKKWLINKLSISNEKVERFETFCPIKWLKSKLNTFISIKDVLEKEKQSQPLVQNDNNQNINNSSFIPMNVYPNYYSGIVPGIQQMQPMQQMPQEELKTIDSNDNLQ